MDDGKQEQGQIEPIETEQEQEKKTTFYFIAAVIIIVGITAALFFFRNVTPKETIEEITYNGFVFHRYAGLWNTTWQRDDELYSLRLHYNPYEVENISIIGQGWTAKDQTYITFDPEGERFDYVALSAAELSLSLHNTFGVVPIAACTSNATADCAARKIIKCNSMPNGTSAIYLKVGEPEQVTISKGCLIIQGTDEGLVMAAEKAIYRMYGIMMPN